MTCLLVCERKHIVLNISAIRTVYALLFIMLLFCMCLPEARATAELDDILTKNYPLQRDDLERAVGYKLERGAANLSIPSSLLIRASERALQAGREEEARVYAEYAVKLAPAYPPAYVQWVRVCWTQERYRVDRLCEGLWKYVSATMTNYIPAVFFLSSLLSVFLLAVLLTLSVFSLLSLYRYFKLFIHDLGHLFPIPLPRHLAFFSGLLIFMLPLFFKWSMVIIFFYWLLLLFVYHSRREQKIIIVFTFYLLCSPFLVQILSQFIATNTDEVFYRIQQANEDDWDEQTRQVLSRWLSAHPDDAEALFALGLMNKREGRIDESRRSYGRLLDKDPLNCRAWCNLGNSLLAAGKPGAAIEHYQKSVELCPESVEGHYNLSRVQLLEYMFPESNKSFNRAKELDPDRVNQFVQIYSEHPNRMVIDQTTPARTYWQKTFMPTDAKESLAAYLWERFFAGIPYQYRYSVAFVCLVFIVLFLTDRSRSHLAIACEYCGCAVCKKCKRLVLEHRLCKQCASIFKGKKDLMMSIASKEVRAGVIERFHGRQMFASKCASLIFPGSGQLLLDYPFQGIGILFLFFVCVVKLFPGAELTVNPFLMVRTYFGTGIAAIALIVVYLYSLWHFNCCSIKLAQFIALIRVTRREFQIKE